MSPMYGRLTLAKAPSFSVQRARTSALPYFAPEWRAEFIEYQVALFLYSFCNF